MNAKRNRFICLAVLAVWLLLSGCSFSSGKIELTYHLPFDPQSLDPQIAATDSAYMILSNCLEGLLTKGPGGTILPASAESYTVSADGTLYTFTIKANAKWSNGETLTADDFVFAFRRLFDKETAASSAPLFFAIKNSFEILSGTLTPDQLGVQAISPNKLTITLTSPQIAFPELLTLPAAMPCNEAFFLSTDGKYGLNVKGLLSNGPFVLRSWVPDAAITLKKNEEYSGKKSVSVSLLRFLTGFSQADTIKAYQKEEVFAAILNGNSFAALSSSNYEKFENRNYVLLFNKKSGVFANRNIRKAIAAAFKRDSYLSYCTESERPSFSLLPESISFGGTSYRSAAGRVLTPDYNPEEAKNLLKQGLSELSLQRLPQIDVLVSQGSRAGKLFIYAQQALQQDAGIYLGLKEISSSDFDKALQEQNYDAVILPLTPQTNSPASLLSLFSAENAELSSLLSDASSAANSKDAIVKYAAAEQRILRDEALVVPICFEADYFITANKINGVYFSPFKNVVYFKDAKLR